MPSLVHEVGVFRFLQVVVTLLTAIHVRELLAENLLYGSRLGTFPKPDFRTNFTLKSNQGSSSFKEIRHGLNVDPFYVRVYARPQQGHNSDFCFNGIGSSQSSPSRSSYGGLIFAYDSEFVRIWAPTDPRGHVVFVKDGWGGEVNTQESDEAEVVVEIWRDGPAPTFQVEHVIDTRVHISGQVYHKVDHELRQLPERVLVRLSPVESPENNGKNPNKGFWFHAVAASQNPDPSNNFGGVIFAYNERYVRLWAPDGVNNNTGCIFVGQEWAGGLNTQKATKCRVETLLWVNQLPTPTFQTDWFDFSGQRDHNSFREIAHGENRLPALVIVQLRAVNGKNIGYVFEAQGATQSDDDGTNEYGGVVFAYDENRVRIWAPSKHDESKKGYPLLVKSGWGYGSNLQSGRDKVQIRVLLYSSKCNSSSEALCEGDNCVTTLYDSYTTVVSQWSECSSICNNGTKSRLLTGCDVASKKRILSCDFDDGSLCGWTNKRTGGTVRWVTSNTSTPESNTGPLWGHPKGSYFAYTNTTTAAPNMEVTLTSPNIHGADNCHLRFFWNMYGSDIGTLKVMVNTKRPSLNPNGNWRDSGWAMKGPQGDIFWRSAFVNLEMFSKIYRQKIYQIRFVHTLPESDCNRGSQQCTVCKYQKCPTANVAIDNIRLDCQEVIKVPLEMCKERTATLSGCEIHANMPLTTGPAYSIETVNTEKFVKAVGSYHDLIATYEFKVAFTASYVVWKQTFATSNKTNDVSFRIDEGDWVVWRPPHKGSHALWTQYYFQTFKLKPGIHTVSLRQEEPGFRVSKLAIVPTEISMWTDLGMQSRYIPDSSLIAFPKTSSPEPRFGRLHAEDAWCSSDHNKNYVFFQIKLPQLALVSGISVQGGKDILQKLNDYWITSFKVKVSLDGKKYTWYRDTSGRRTFQANKDASSIFHHTLMFAAPARGLRIYPQGWKNWICLRTELYGFYLSSEMCASSGPIQSTSKACVGDRNCGQNAECAKAPRVSRVQKQVIDGYSDDILGNVTGESCHCYQGYHGPSCEHFGCSSNPCLNGGSCSEGNNTFSCKCQPGYHGYTCQHPCKFGYYGYNCSQQCQCTKHGICDIATGHCNCKQGYHGTYCERVCSPGYFGYNCAQRCQCRNGAWCDPVTGLCNCSLGWTGAVCDKPCLWNTWGVNCTLNCSCWKSAEFCDRFTGTCVCLPGYTGEKCQLPCPSGTYGYNCSERCRCQNNAVCSRKDGTCNCTRPGWTGVLCHHPCRQGSYGVNCVNECMCQNNAACDRESGTCTCMSGWSGEFCDKPCKQGVWGLNCSTPCSCVHGAHCNSTNGQCTCQASDGCQCAPGWTGSDCSVPCNDSSWGPNCNKACLCQHNRGTCHHVTGQCLCKPGWTGTQCDKVCPQGSSGFNCTQSCFCVHGTCSAVNGSCECLPGYHGDFCDRPCATGQYGPGCSMSCQCNNGAACDHVTGQCRCSAGWTGKTCGQSCQTGHFGANCSQRCVCPGSCDPLSGICSCRRGFQGPNCVETCAIGRYGVNCAQRCQCMNNASCDHVNGTCTCAPGWSGVNCTRSCRAGYYGMLCASKCRCSANGTDAETSCDSVTGVCNCKPGYQGFRCEEQCPEGYFGKNCNQRCNCKNSYACSFTDGSCTCKPGFYGAACHLSCPSDRYGVNCNGTCQCVMPNTVSCDRVDGTCFCSDGFTGVYCESVCPEGLYGRDCTEKCTCQNGAACDHVTGMCACTAGFKGQSCETACADGWFGVNCAHKCLCRNGAKCSRFNGECICAPGYKGNYCENECSSGRFGVHCKNICDCNLQNSPRCDPRTGVCVCSPGFKGPRCDEHCEDGFYGQDCNTPCPICSSHVLGPCEKSHGNCSCSPGYQGYLCLDDCDLKHYGLQCKMPCECSADELCHHINGMCLDITQGKFSIIVNDSMEDLGDLVRQRDIKRGLERLMELYYDDIRSSEPQASATSSSDGGAQTQARLDMLEGNNESSLKTNRPSGRSPTPARVEGNKETTSAEVKHVFMVRLLDRQLVDKEDKEKATRVVCVLLDNFTVVNGHYVDEVLSRVSPWNISSELKVDYYSGKLYRKKTGSTVKIHLPLIIGVSVGFFLIVILALFALIRRRYKQKCGFAAYKKGNTKDQAEFELQPWIGRNTGYLLAFDNPYYDVLAAMGLDDDIEEDYYNPLYDDVSMYSDSGTSEDSCHKDLSSMVIRS